VAYATVAELTEYLGLTANLYGGTVVTTERTARLAQAIDAATAHIEQDTGRVFTSTTATKRLTCDGGDVLLIPDLVSVTTLKVDDNADGVYEITLTTSDYELNTYHETQAGWPFEYIVRLDDSWPIRTYAGRRRLVEIVGVWGWSAVPTPIKQACLLLSARLVQRSNAALGVQAMGDLGGFGIRSSDPDYDRLVSPYRIIPL
jgi:hypothetical protein